MVRVGAPGACCRTLARVDLDDGLSLVAALVGEDRTVLQVGDGDAALASALTLRGCRVSGLRTDQGRTRAIDLAELAELVELVEVVDADLDLEPLSRHFKRETFDVVLLDDAWAEVADPVGVLRDAATLVVPGGRVLVTVPNAGHGSLRLGLLQGSPRRQPRHVYTRATLCDALEDAGLSVDELHATVRDPLDTEIPVDGRSLPALVIEWMRHQPDALDHRYVAVAGPAAPAVFPSRPEVRPTRPYDAVRATDEHTRRMAEDRAVRQRLLTVRDHIIGMETTVASANARVVRTTARAKFAERRARRYREQVEALTTEVGRLQAAAETPTWRRLLSRPARDRSRGDQAPSP